MPFLPDDLANSLAIQRLCDALETDSPVARREFIQKARKTAQQVTDRYKDRKQESNETTPAVPEEGD